MDTCLLLWIHRICRREPHHTSRYSYCAALYGKIELCAIQYTNVKTVLGATTCQIQ